MKSPRPEFGESKRAVLQDSDTVFLPQLLLLTRQEIFLVSFPACEGHVPQSMVVSLIHSTSYSPVTIFSLNLYINSPHILVLISEVFQYFVLVKFKYHLTL